MSLLNFSFKAIKSLYPNIPYVWTHVNPLSQIRLAIKLSFRPREPAGDVFWGGDLGLAIELALRWDKPTGGAQTPVA